MIGYLFLAILIGLTIGLAVEIRKMWKRSTAEMERRSRR